MADGFIGGGRFSAGRTGSGGGLSGWELVALRTLLIWLRVRIGTDKIPGRFQGRLPPPGEAKKVSDWAWS